MSEIDPRLAALGLAEPMPPAPAPAAVAAAPVPPAAAPVPVAAAAPAVPVAPAASSPPVAAAPAPAASAALLRVPIEVGFPARRGEVAVALGAITVVGKTTATLGRHEISEVRASRGQVIVSAGATRLAFRPVVDGLAEPTLAAPLARVIEEAVAGRFSRSGSAFTELENAADGLVDRFHDEDDPLIPGAVALVLLLCGVALAAILPYVFAVGVTQGPLPPGAFLIDAPVPSFDPRVLVAAVSGAGLLASLGVRLGLGAAGLVWARGTLRGWRRDRLVPVRLARRALAAIVQYPGALAAAFLFCLVATLPAARTQVAIDANGIRVVRELPFLDEVRSWRDVTDVAMVPPAVDPLRYDIDVRILWSGGAIDTHGKYLIGGSEFQLLQRASAWREAAR